MRLTRRVSSFQHPICVFRVSNELTVPFYLKMAGCFLQKRRTGKVVNVEPRFGRHFEDEIELKRENIEITRKGKNTHHNKRESYIDKSGCPSRNSYVRKGRSRRP
jgi:hypothetical protein